MSRTTLIRAALVAPIDAPPIVDGGVVVEDGILVTVGVANGLRGDLFDCGDALLVPGLVNAHTHLELSDRTPGDRPASFADWIGAMANTGQIATPAEATRTGIAECLRFGVTCVGDISKFARDTRQVLGASPLRGVSYGEALGFGVAQQRFDEGLREALAAPVGGRVVKGVTPHAPYTVNARGYDAALATGLPLATHLAESPEEHQFVREIDGPLADVWRRLGAWDPTAIEAFPGSPVAYAEHLGLLDGPTVLAHCNYVDDDDLDLLAAGRAGVVYCPRTHDHFGHPPHRWREMLARGVRVALGTDSRASSPDLNLLEDARQLASAAEAVTLWRMLTLGGAEVLGLANEIGSLTPGKYADLAAFPLDRGEGLQDVIASPRPATHVWIEGILVRG